MLQPIHDRILVKPLNPDTVTRSGIVIPDSAQEKPVKGIVISTGKGKVLDNGTVIALTVKEHDVVLYGKHAGQTVKIDSEDFVVLKEDEVLAIVQE